MVDTVSIIIAVISFVGALLSTSITGWFAYTSEERRRLSEAEKLVSKYRDPLLLAAYDLQSRLYNIVEGGFLQNYAASRGTDAGDGTADDDYALQYTCFLVGQYFSWTYILRRQVQFLRFSTDKENKGLARVFDQLREAFGSSRYGRAGAPFMLWRGHQMAIGEVMTVKDDAELLCMGYAAFKREWRDSREFRDWFRSIEDGVATLSGPTDREVPFPDHRLRRLQHLLLDLIQMLDPKGLRVQEAGTRSKLCRAAPRCGCSQCRRPPPPGKNTNKEYQV